MQISTTGTAPAPTVLTARPEAAERGPDRDNDGDEAKATAALPPAQPVSPAGKGGKLDVTA